MGDRECVGQRVTSAARHTGPISDARTLVFLFAFVKLLGKIVFDTHFTNGVQLALQVVDMFFLVGEDLLKQRAGSVVSDFGRDLDGSVQVLDRMQFQREIAFKLSLDVAADIDFPDVSHVRSSVEEQNPVHQLFRVNHFFDGFFAVVRPEPEIAPVIAYFAVKEILVDGCELRL